MFIFAAKAKIAPVGRVRNGSHHVFVTSRTWRTQTKTSPRLLGMPTVNVSSSELVSRSSLGFNYCETYEACRSCCVCTYRANESKIMYTSPQNTVPGSRWEDKWWKLIIEISASDAQTVITPLQERCLFSICFYLPNTRAAYCLRACDCLRLAACVCVWRRCLAQKIPLRQICIGFQCYSRLCGTLVQMCLSMSEQTEENKLIFYSPSPSIPPLLRILFPRCHSASISVLHTSFSPFRHAIARTQIVLKFILSVLLFWQY